MENLFYYLFLPLIGIIIAVLIHKGIHNTETYLIGYTDINVKTCHDVYITYKVRIIERLENDYIIEYITPAVKGRDKAYLISTVDIMVPKEKVYYIDPVKLNFFERLWFHLNK